MTGYVVRLALLLRLAIQLLRHPLLWARLLTAVLGMYLNVLRESVKDRLRMHRWSTSDRGPIRNEANRKMALRAVFVSYWTVTKIQERVTELDLMNADYARSLFRVSKAAQAYLSVFNNWNRFSSAPNDFGAVATEFSTALAGYLKHTPPKAILSFSESAIGFTGTSKTDPRSPLKITAPKTGDFLLRLFLPKKDREAIPGDLEEEFFLMVGKFGLALARTWYWVQVVASISAVNSNRLWKLWRWVVAMALFRVFH